MKKHIKYHNYIQMLNMLDTLVENKTKRNDKNLTQIHTLQVEFIAFIKDNNVLLSAKAYQHLKPQKSALWCIGAHSSSILSTKPQNREVMQRHLATIFIVASKLQYIQEVNNVLFYIQYVWQNYHLFFRELQQFDVYINTLIKDTESIYDYPVLNTDKHKQVEIDLIKILSAWTYCKQNFNDEHFETDKALFLQAIKQNEKKTRTYIEALKEVS